MNFMLMSSVLYIVHLWNQYFVYFDTLVQSIILSKTKSQMVYFLLCFLSVMLLVYLFMYLGYSIAV